MPFGFFVSLAMHCGLLAWAFVSMQSTKPLNTEETQAITVAIISPSELTRLKQGDPDAKKLEAKAKEKPKPEISKKEAPKPKPITAPPPAAQEPPDPIADKLAALPKEEPKPAPGPTPAEIAKQKAALEAAAALAAKKKAAEEAKKKAEAKKKDDAKKKAEAKKKAAAKKKREKEKKRKAAAKRKKREAEKRRKAAAKKKKQFDADRIAALIDKSPDKRGAPKRSRNPSEPTDYDGPTAGERHGRDTVLSAREEDLLKGAISAQLRDCWRLPGGGGGIETVVVTLQWRLKPDGSLDGEPRVQHPQNGPVFRIAAESAVRAVKGCSPFRLPPEKYTSWRSITWDFDPRDML